jgi:hypothetical protein
MVPNLSGKPRKVEITIGKIWKVYPEGNIVDVFLLDGSLLPRVQIMANSASSRTGKVEIPIPEYTTDLTEAPEKLGAFCTAEENDVFVIVAFLESNINRPIVLGYLFPEEAEILCSNLQDGNSDGSMFLWKHKSNVYARVDENGDTEISHPSGVLVKIGKNTSRTEILNYDNKGRPFKWKKGQADEFASPPWMTITHPSGNYITIDPNGNVVENIVGDVSRTIRGNVTETVMGNVTRNVIGESTEVVTGASSRSSLTSITDAAPIILHIEG